MAAVHDSTNASSLDDWKKTLDDKIVRSPCKPFELPNVTLFTRVMSSLKIHAALHPRRAAVTDAFNQERSLTYKQIHDQALSFGAYLRFLGLGIGDRATAVLRNCIEYPVVHLGVWAVGGIFVGSNSLLTKYDTVYQIRDVASTVVITSEDLLDSVLSAVKECPSVKYVICIRSSTGPLPAGVFDYHAALYCAPMLECATVSTDSPCTIMYSSGTTGPPKGIVHSHNSFQYIVESFRSHFMDEVYPALGIRDVDWYKENQLLVAPFFHVSGFSQINWMLITGSPIILMDHFDGPAYAGFVAQFKPRYLFVGPTHMIFFAKNPIGRAAQLDSVQFMLCGAAPLGQQICDEFLHSHPSVKFVVQAYGMTETGATLLPLLRREGIDASCGVVTAGWELKMVVPGSEQPCKRGECGEMRVKGPGLTMGYYNKPDATKALFDSEGFLITGDVGYLDERGCVYIVGRVQELIQVHYKGQALQVAPAQLEGVLLSSCSISDAAIIGVASDKGGELICAIVVKAEKTLSAADVERLVAENLAEYCRITGGVIFVDVIPRSVYYKILRREIKEKYQEEIMAKHTAPLMHSKL